jgi:alpha,alpha-trehalase
VEFRSEHASFQLTLRSSRPARKHQLPEMLYRTVHLLGLLLYAASFARVDADSRRDREDQVDVFNGEEEPVYMCDASQTSNWNIYCQGPIVESVNYHKLFNDSKDFVDMPLKSNPDVVLANFQAAFQDKPANQIDRDQLNKFVKDNFDEPGSELENCTLTDWQEYPPKLKAIQDPTFREWAYELNGIWRHLCKKTRAEVEKKIQQYSLLYVPHHFIVPGGRFREFYYWDAYWIIKGLMASGMHDTVAAMIRNLASMVDSYGFVPNGGRVYYLRRSQPPMLTPMVYEHYEATGNVSFLKELLPTLEKELAFWDANRGYNLTLGSQSFGVYRYRTASNTPRPESYKEDIASSANMNGTAKQFFYRATATAAEAGWDFSTRWFRDRMHLETVETHRVLPADLNAFVCWNLDILEYFNEQIGNHLMATIFRERRAKLRDAVESIFYNSTTGAWHDFNLRLNRHNTEFYPSVAVPLFTNCYDNLDQSKSERLYSFMQNVGAYNYAGGIPTSQIKDSGEQWDFPNGWAPLQHMIIEGLRKSRDPMMQDQAFSIATKWVTGNYKVWKDTKGMWEKYNVIGEQAPGKGGEYEVQTGFGWSNGVILDLLVTYGDRLKWSEPEQPDVTKSGSALNPMGYITLSLFCLTWMRL